MHRLRRTPKIRTLIAFSSLIMLLFCVFVAYQASKAYEQAIDDGLTDAERLANIVADQVELTLLSVDVTLNSAVERHYFNQLFGGNLSGDTSNHFRMWVDETPHIAAMMLVDADGNVQVAAHKPEYVGWFDYRRTMRGIAAFEYIRTASDQPFYIGRNRSYNGNPQNLIYMSRKITNISGEFGGIVLAAIDADMFGTFLNMVDQGDSRFLALMLEDGALLYNSDTSAMHASDALVQHMAGRVAERGTDSRMLSETISLYEHIKVYATRGLESIPVTVAVAMDEDHFLGIWRSARVKDITFLAIFTIFGSVLSFFALTMAKQIIRVEESEQSAILASQAKSEFLANMSHELRTPLNAIIGFSEMMQAGYFGKMNDKQKERIHDIHLCGSHLLQLISDILEFSKGEAGKLELDLEPVDVPEIMEECVRMMRERAKTKEINLFSDAQDPLPQLYGDKRKLRQILLNLISNAVKFTPEGGEVRLYAKRDGQGQMIVSVTDTGVGIPEDQIATALSVFGQVHRSKSHEGTGLGLPLCKMFAELHGGRLELSSIVGEGTTIRIIFPLEKIIIPGKPFVEELSA